MNTTANSRILRELAQWQDNDETDTGIRLEQIDESSVSKFRGCVKGPTDTPYAGGSFFLDIELTADYPFRPPKTRFSTRVWHPNVSSVTGAICLDLLTIGHWSPVMTLRTLLLSLRALLCEPRPDNPQDAVVAGQFINRNAEFQRTARYWTRHFAAASGPVDEELDEKVRTISNMGYNNKDLVVEALSHCQWNVQLAVTRLIGQAK